MSDKDAPYYHAHKDDPGEWEEVPAPLRRKPKRRLDAIISVRFSPTEQDLLRHAAERRGESLSTFIRRAALRASDQPVPRATTGFALPQVSVLSRSINLTGVVGPTVQGLPRPSDAATASGVPA